MRSLFKSAILAAVVVAGVQTAALAWMIWDRVSLIRAGREVVLPIVPVDPRSLFRGDYVILSYPFSRVSTSLAEAPMPEPGAPVYVVLRQETVDGHKEWKPIRILARPPQRLGADEIVLKGRTRFGARTPWEPNRTVALRYGIESYFVPEGKGKELETMVRDKRMAAIVAVDGQGNAAIKGLAIDGEKIYDEPIF